MTTNIYIDGFNLYYGALRETSYRWLNPETLCQLLLPKNTIGEIKYFTALVSARPNDPDQPVRQQLYLRALGTLPKVSVHLGHFLTHQVTMPLVVPPGQPQKYARVIKTEEKGSDVNLATHLLHDAHMGRFEVAVVVSNDSDLLDPIKIVREELHKRVGNTESAPTSKPGPPAAYRLHQADSRWRSENGAIPSDAKRRTPHVYQTRGLVRSPFSAQQVR